jgi:hypothetical protein
MKLRPGEYRGRNGELLVREKVRGSNKFDFPDSIKEAGWSYQWIRHTVYGDPTKSELSSMRRSGWREVSPEALNGYFRDMVPEGCNHIEIEGLILMERPEGMTKEAQQEALDAANRQYASASIDKIYDEHAREKMPSGIEPWLQQVRDNRRNARYERAPDAWQPDLRAAVSMDD